MGTKKLGIKEICMQIGKYIALHTLYDIYRDLLIYGIVTHENLNTCDEILIKARDEVYLASTRDIQYVLLLSICMIANRISGCFMCINLFVDRKNYISQNSPQMLNTTLAVSHSKNINPHRIPKSQVSNKPSNPAPHLLLIPLPIPNVDPHVPFLAVCGFFVPRGTAHGWRSIPIRVVPATISTIKYPARA
jgi:hypothetical protein